MKKLPVTLNTKLTTECWTFTRLAAILSSPKYIPWFIERFIYCVVDENYFFGYSQVDSLEALCNYDEIITCKNIIDKTNIVEKIIQEIDNNGYVVLLCDYYYVEGSKEYLGKHRLHNILIYGYDNESMEFCFVGFSINNKYWAEHVIKYNELEVAFQSSLSTMSENIDEYIDLYRLHLPATVFYLIDSFDRQPRLEVIYASITKCLRGGEVLVPETEGDIFCSGVRRFGVSIYKSYYEDLYNILLKMTGDLATLSLERMDPIEGALKALAENKSRLVSIWKYLDENGYVSISKDVIDSTEALGTLLEQMHKLSIKYWYTQDIKYLELVRCKLMEAEKLDISILSAVRDILYEYMKSRIL